MHKTVSISLFLVLLIPVLSTCGLLSSDTISIEKPNIDNALLDPYLSTVTVGFAVPYENDSSDNDVFTMGGSDSPYTVINGFEIYYKIYTSDSSSIQSDEDQFDESSSGYIYETGSKKMTRLGFHRMKYGVPNSSDLTSSTPIILHDDATGNEPTINSDAENKISLQMYEAVLLVFSLENGEVKVVTNQSALETTSYIPYRTVKDSTGKYKPFSDNVEDGDADRNGVSTSDTQYKVSFVAFSYISSIMSELLGINYENSVPAFLGTVEFNN